MFLYFVPGPPGKVNEIDAWKARIDGAIKRECKAGPNGQPGMILADKSCRGLVGYYPDKQRWERDGDMWVGMPTDIPITPEDLARSPQIPGHYVTLNDGNNWLIPTVFKYTETGMQPNVPRVLVWKDKEWYYGNVVREYEDLFNKTAPFFESWYATMSRTKVEKDDTEVEVSIPFGSYKEMELFVLGLQTNYRVSFVEITLLQIARDDVIYPALLAMIDEPNIIESLKKKQQD